MVSRACHSALLEVYYLLLARLEKVLFLHHKDEVIPIYPLVRYKWNPMRDYQPALYGGDNKIEVCNILWPDPDMRVNSSQVYFGYESQDPT